MNCVRALEVSGTLVLGVPAVQRGEKSSARMSPRKYGNAQKLELGAAGGQEVTFQLKEAPQLPERVAAQIRSIAADYVRGKHEH